MKLALTALVVLASSIGSAHAQRAVPAPSWARSLEIIDDGAPIVAEPRADAVRRGIVEEGARLPLLARVLGSGCRARAYYQVGPGRFVCAEYGRPNAGPPSGRRLPEVATGALLPFAYGMIAEAATPAYTTPADQDYDGFARVLGEGYGVVVAAQTEHLGQRFLQLDNGLYVRAEDVSPAQPSRFGGRTLAEGEALDFAWTLRRTGVLRRPGGRVLRSLGRREIVRVAAPPVDGFVELVDGGFVRDRHIARVTRTTRPSEVSPGERWIDIDVAEQVAVAYVGERPVYATLVSTGRRNPRTRTPLGAHRIWVKLAWSTMANNAEAGGGYSMSSVPWVQYFDEGNGLHAAYWHDEFGRARSHGCVNLSPKDAEWLFRFTGPTLEPGWVGVYPARPSQGTVVRVRDSSQTPAD